MIVAYGPDNPEAPLPSWVTEPAWAAEPAEQLDWGRITGAMERDAVRTGDPVLFEVSQIVAVAVSAHADYRQGCETCDASSFDRCPGWAAAQRLMFAWVLDRLTSALPGEAGR